MKRIVVLLSLFLCACPQNNFDVSTTPPAATTTESSLTECSIGAVTSAPCAIKKSGIVVSDHFGFDILNWGNSLGTTVVTATIPNGFYANQGVSFTEPNLIPANIKSGVSIFGVTGNVTSNSCETGLVFAGASGSTGTSATNTTIQWTPVAGAYGYTVLNATTNPYTVVGSAVTGASSFSVTGLTAGTNYKFRVKAFSSGGLSDCNVVDVSVTTGAQSQPADLADLAIWLKPESLTGYTDGAPVNLWTDSSTNARQFTGAGAIRPVYRANVLNSYGALEFDGVDDELAYGADYATNNFTLFYVATPLGTHEIDGEATSGTGGLSGQRYISYPVQSGTDGGAGGSFATNGMSVYEHGNSYLPALAVSGAAQTGPTIVVISYASKQPTIYSALTQLRIGLTSGVPNVHAPRHLGSSSIGAFQGNIYEFISYSRTLTNQERTDIVNYLKAKYGI